jgi:hypothetical protein
MRWSLESSDQHESRHDSDQLRYWMAQPFAARLAQAEAYRARVLGAGPHRLIGTLRVLPSVVRDGAE